MRGKEAFYAWLVLWKEILWQSIWGCRYFQVVWQLECLNHWCWKFRIKWSTRKVNYYLREVILILIQHVLSCMASHIVAVYPVSAVTIKIIHSIISSFFWGDNNGRAKMKRCAWTKICKPIEEGRAGNRDLDGIKKAFQMKFA